MKFTGTTCPFGSSEVENRSRKLLDFARSERMRAKA
jgi:hypothetical protein